MKSVLTLWLIGISFIYCSGQTNTKFSSAVVANAPCVDEGFEGLANAPLTSTAWLSTIAVSTSTGVLCSGSITYTVDASRTMVVPTPTSDAIIGSIPNSPFTGSKVLRLNRNTAIPGARVSQTFSVTSSNFVYRYAYMGCYVGGGHTLCQGSGLMFRFYDCNNNLISSFSKSMSMISNPDLTYWTSNISDGYTTPDWVVFNLNLSAYIGSCITVQISAGGCITGGHAAFCYYDAECSDKFINMNNNFGTSSSFNSCQQTATLSGLSGFSTYYWQGPASSGVNGSTVSSVTSQVPGTYSLTVTSGTNTFMQTLNLSFSNASLTINNNAAACPGQTFTLQATGSGISSYTWNTSSNQTSLVVSPQQTTTYSIAATASNNCVLTASQTILIFPSPTFDLSPSQANVCSGQSMTLGASSSANYTYSWSTGSNQGTTVVNPTVSTVYSVTATSAQGCVSYSSMVVNILPALQSTLSPVVSVCSGDSIALQVFHNGISSCNWSNGASGALIVVSPTVNTVYTASLTNSSGCSSVKTVTVTVNALPQLFPGSSQSSVCVGNTVAVWADLTGQYASYMWNTGANTNSFVVSPTQNSVYSVTVTSSGGCKSSYTQSVNTWPLPTVQASASSVFLCVGETLTLTAWGSNNLSYLWSTGSTAPVTTTIASTGSSQYSVTATDLNGCKNTAVTLVTVNECTGLKESIDEEKEVLVFPNPAGESFKIKTFKNTSGYILDELGRTVRKLNFDEKNNHEITVRGLSPGIYFVETEREKVKLIVK